MNPSFLMNSPASMYANPHGYYPSSHFSPISIESSMHLQNSNTHQNLQQASPNQSFKMVTPRISARSSLDSPAVHFFRQRTSSDPQHSALSFQKQQSNINVNSNDGNNIPNKHLNQIHNHIRDTSPSAGLALPIQNYSPNHPIHPTNTNYNHNNYPLLPKRIVQEDQKYYQIVNQSQFQKNLVTEHQPEIVNLHSNSLSYLNTSKQRQQIFDSSISSSSSSKLNHNRNTTEISSINPPNSIRILQTNPRNTSATSMDQSIQTNQIFLQTNPTTVQSSSSSSAIPFLPVRSQPTTVSSSVMNQYQQASYSPQPRLLPQQQIPKNDKQPTQKIITVQNPPNVAQQLPQNTLNHIQIPPNPMKQSQNQILQFPLKVSNYQPQQQSVTQPQEFSKSKQFNQMPKEKEPLFSQLTETNQVKQTVQGRKSNFEKIFNQQDTSQDVIKNKLQEQQSGSSSINDQQSNQNNQNLKINGIRDYQQNNINTIPNDIEIMKNNMQLEINELTLTLKKQEQQIVQLVEQLAMSQENLQKEKIHVETSEKLNNQLKKCICGDRTAWESLLKSQWMISEPLRQSIQDRILLIEEIHDRNKELKEKIIEIEIFMEESRGLMNINEQYVSQINKRIEVQEIQNEELMIQLAVMDYLRDYEKKQLVGQIQEIEQQMKDKIDDNEGLRDQIREYEKVMEENNEVIKQINQENRNQIEDNYDDQGDVWEMEDKSRTEMDQEIYQNNGKNQYDEEQGEEERNYQVNQGEHAEVDNTNDSIIVVISQPFQQQYVKDNQFNGGNSRLNNRQSENQFNEIKQLYSQRQDIEKESEIDKDGLIGRKTNQEEEEKHGQSQIIHKQSQNEQNIKEGQQILNEMVEQQHSNGITDIEVKQIEETETEKNQNAIINEAKILYEQYLTGEQLIQQTRNQVQQDNCQSEHNQIQTDITFNEKEDEDNHSKDAKDSQKESSKEDVEEAEGQQLKVKSNREELSKDGNDNKNTIREKGSFQNELKVGYLTGPGYSESEDKDFTKKQTVIKPKKSRNEGIKDYSKYIQALKQNLKESKEQRLELEEQVNLIMEASKQALFQDYYQDRNVETSTEQIFQDNKENQDSFNGQNNQNIQNYYDSEESPPGLEESQDFNEYSQNRDIDESQNVFGNRMNNQYQASEEEDNEQQAGYI